MKNRRTEPKSIGEILGGLVTAGAKGEQVPGFVQRRDDYFLQMERRRMADLSAEMERKAIPPHHATRAVASTLLPRQTDAIRWVARAVELRIEEHRRPITLVLSGTPGSGKTCAACWGLLNHPGSALFVIAQAIAAHPDNGWSENATTWERWRDVRMLAIDELGDERGGEGSNASFEALFAERHNRGYFTVATTNLDADTFSARYVGGRVYSRLQHEQARDGMTPAESLALGGFPWWVEVGDPDLRRGNHAA